MILTDKNGEVINTLESESAVFEIENSAKLFDILSNKIYEDAVRAIVRELSCNAIDANTAAGITTPIKVYLPTNNSMSLIIEDEGIGMTHDDVMTVYRSYGKSTKANSNLVIGALGIGGKSPLAYTDQFSLVTSRDGKKNTYIIFRDENGIPNVNRVNSEDSDKTGTSVEMVVRKEDIEKFHYAAIKTFLFFNTMPIIARGEEEFYNHVRYKYCSYNAKYPKSDFETAREVLKKDYIYESDKPADGQREYANIIRKIIQDYGSTHGIVMGQVFYNVNPALIQNTEEYDKEAELVLNFPITSGYTGLYKVFHMPIGSVAIQPSREALSYNKETVKLLQNRFNATFADWFKLITTKYDTPAKFLKNHKNIPHAKKLRIFEDYSSTQNCFVTLKELAHDIRTELFSKVWNDSAFLYSVRTNNRGAFELHRVNNTIGKFGESSTIKDTVASLLYESTVHNFIVIDNDDMKRKIRSMDEKARGKGRFSFTCPVALKNRLIAANINNTILVTQAELKDVNKYLQIDSIDYSSIKLPETEEKEIKARQAVIRKAGRIIDIVTNDVLDFDELVKENKKNVITYELFEGEPKKKGWFYAPLLKECLATDMKAKKEDLIHIVRHGPWEQSRHEVVTCRLNRLAKLGIVVDVPKKHVLLDWQSFKKFDIIHDKRFQFIDTFYLKELDAAASQVNNLLSHLNIYSVSICTPGQTVAIKSAYSAKAIMGTDLWKELDRFDTERNMNETDYTSIRHELMKIVGTLQNGVWGWSPLARELEAASAKWVPMYDKMADVEKNIGNYRVDYKTAIFKKYPMLSYLLNAKAILSDTDINTLVDYVKLVEGI
jgi:hypothetical protein